MNQIMKMVILSFIILTILVILEYSNPIYAVIFSVILILIRFLTFSKHYPKT